MGLIHRAVIQRSEAIKTPISAQGVTGQPIADWTAGLQVFKSYTAYLPPDADVLNEDRVKQVEMEDGEIVGPFIIETVTPRRDRRGVRLIVLSLKKVD